MTGIHARKRRGAKPDRDPAEVPESELVAALQCAAWQWFCGRRSVRVPVPAQNLTLGDTTVPDGLAPTDGPSANEKPAKRLTKHDAPSQRMMVLRRAAWAWLKRMPVRGVQAHLVEPKKRRSKRDVVPETVLAFRRWAWAWFAPRATGEAAAGTRLPLRTTAPAVSTSSGDVVLRHLKGVLEALIFASEHPLPAKELARLAKTDLKVAKMLLAELVDEYHGRGFRLDEVAGGFVFRTSPLFAPFVREQVAKKPVRMSRAQVETLAIVAYRQPITRPEIDEVRGVDSGAVLKSLLERDLVRILGKKDEPGRPMLYGTTSVFLEFFGLKALGDLPTLREFTELSDESRRTYERELGEEPSEANASSMPSGLMGGEGEMRQGNVNGHGMATETPKDQPATTVRQALGDKDSA